MLSKTSAMEGANVSAELNPALPTVSARHNVPRRERIQALDGLRGVAILLVLILHFTPDLAMPSRPLEWLKKLAQSGWVGVDLFFVLSGFLITGILLDSKSDRFFFRNFYMRRTLRIFPLYFAALAVAFLLLPPLLHLGPSALEALRASAPWLCCYCANIGWPLQGAVSVPWPAVGVDLRHFWSLSVEEHFYLLWPLVVFFCPIRNLPWVCATIFLLSLATRFAGLLAYDSHSLFFYTTLCRLDGLTVGACVAVLARTSTLTHFVRPSKWIVASGATVLAVFFVMHKGLWSGHWFMRTVGLACLAAVFAAVLIIVVSFPAHSLGARLFEHRSLQFFGKYSYGLYVIHGLTASGLERLMPIRWWLDIMQSPVLATIGSIVCKIAISTLLALASWHLLERHFLRLKRNFV